MRDRIWHPVPKRYCPIGEEVAVGSPAPTARVGRRRSTTRGDIADVAIDLFSAHGFDAVSVDDVAAAAGIARRTLFRYYTSKNAILWGDFDTHLEHLAEAHDRLLPLARLHVRHTLGEDPAGFGDLGRRGLGGLRSGGPLQGDRTTIGYQWQLRGVINQGSTASTEWSRLSEVGIAMKADGTLDALNQKWFVDYKMGE